MVNIEKEKRTHRRRVAGSNSVHKETVAKQMEQLGVILEKLDRERRSNETVRGRDGKSSQSRKSRTNAIEKNGRRL